MTSNAEEQANASGAAMVHPPKPTKRANAMPSKGRVARGRPRSGKKASSAERRPKVEKAAKQAKPASQCPRGHHVRQSPKPAEAARRRFTERTHESHGLVGAFCLWIPERNYCQANEAQARVREERGRGAPLYRPKADSHNPCKQRAA